MRQAPPPAKQEPLRTGQGSAPRTALAKRLPGLPWNESDSFRETTLQNFANPADREALRRVGRILYMLALETQQHGLPDEPSSTRAELRAIVADLRYLAGYLAMVGRMAHESSLPAPDEALAGFAGGLAGRVGAIAEAIEKKLA